MYLRKHLPNCNKSLTIIPPPAPVPGNTNPIKGGYVCEVCPHISEFPTKAEKRKHVIEMHRAKCPFCASFVAHGKLTRHLENSHPGRSCGVQIPQRMAPKLSFGSFKQEPPQTTPLLWVPGEVKYPSIWTDVTLRNDGGPAPFDALVRHNPLPQRFYCQEHECGRGFSSEAHLQSHTRFFHPKPTKTTEEGTNTISNDTTEVAERSATNSPMYFSAASTMSSPGPGRHSTNTPNSARSPTRDLPQEGYRDTYLTTTVGKPTASTGLVDSPALTQGETCAPSAPIAPASLSLQCRMCDAPPNVGTRPTATMCGHIFCYECIIQHVTLTPRCPVCDNALLLYCLFKLDLPVLS